MPIFKRKHLKLILQGKKTQTRRISRYRLKIGKAYAVRSKMLEPAQARIVITRAWRQQLRNLTPEDIRKEGFTSFTEFRQAWIEIYGTWNPDQIVTAYEFRLPTQKQKNRKKKQSFQIKRISCFLNALRSSLSWIYLSTCGQTTECTWSARVFSLFHRNVLLLPRCQRCLLFRHC